MIVMLAVQMPLRIRLTWQGSRPLARAWRFSRLRMNDRQFMHRRSHILGDQATVALVSGRFGAQQARRAVTRHRREQLRTTAPGEKRMSVMVNRG